MFLAHFGVALAAKKIVPTVSLGTLILSAQWLDLLWPSLLLLNIEKVTIDPGITKVTPLDFIHYPYSHSLLLVTCWALVASLLHFFFMRKRRAAIVIGFLVLSHWVFDLIVHRPDLPLYPGISPLLGFGLWNSVLITVILETAIFFTGLYFYMQVTTPKTKRGFYSLWTLIVILYSIFLLNIFGPPPPDVQSIAWAGHLQWLFVALGFWVDYNRRVFRGARAK